MQKINLIYLKADDGKYLTDGNRFVRAISIGQGQSVDDWSEVTEAYVKKQQAKMTPREFILALLDRGITREQIEELIAANNQAWAELNYATYIERKNPLLDELCSQFGLTPEDVDELFGIVINEPDSTD